ncbi:MAG: ABC transporter ATP-binding protein [Kiritimatiellae bacterium]|nr:ABC transporter ATP-binding protein [Kiritimatiellia bacterium]
MESPDSILEVRDLKVWFPVKKGVFAVTRGYVKAVDGVSFDMRRGETLGVVGESGCGKTTMARAVLGLVRPTAGTIELEGSTGPRDRWRVAQAVFQDPLSSLNPRHTVLELLTEAMVYHGLCPRNARRGRAAALLEAVGMSADVLDRYPHEFSGGQRQRICIARAVSLRPKLLVCDEAVSALDLSVRAQALDLIGGLKAKLGLSVLFITHDIGVVQHVADRVVVMKDGRIVESGDCAGVLKSPSAEYTRYLMSAVPRIGAAAV